MPVKFRKQMIAAEAFESASVFDVNNDGQLDIVSGAFWYAGPGFEKRYFIGPVERPNEHYNDFSTIPLDVNGDGYLDIVTGGWFDKVLRWRENPGKNKGAWREHEIAPCGNVETTRAWDIDGDGQLEVIPNTPNDPLVVYKLVMKNGQGTGEFSKHTVYAQPQGHGLGCGDILGDGRRCLVLRNGWLEPHASPMAEPWTFHPEFDLGCASVPIIVADINGDGRAELIAGQAHGYGLDWWGQRIEGGKRGWVKHPIDPFNSQYHDMLWIDIDGDGKNELVTGKRYRAHDNGDAGAFDDLQLCYFKWNGESFTKQIISHGPVGLGSGCGISFCAADLRGAGRLDIVAPGKDGLIVFYNEGL